MRRARRASRSRARGTSSSCSRSRLSGRITEPSFTPASSASSAMAMRVASANADSWPPPLPPPSVHSGKEGREDPGQAPAGDLHRFGVDAGPGRAFRRCSAPAAPPAPRPRPTGPAPAAPAPSGRRACAPAGPAGAATSGRPGPLLPTPPCPLAGPSPVGRQRCTAAPARTLRARLVDLLQAGLQLAPPVPVEEEARLGVLPLPYPSHHPGLQVAADLCFFLPQRAKAGVRVAGVCRGRIVGLADALVGAGREGAGRRQPGRHGAVAVPYGRPTLLGGEDPCRPPGAPP